MKELVKKIQWKKVIGFFIFMCLLVEMLVHMTYLFRNNGSRERFNGIKSEESLDVVCIGGSATFVYWEPFLAWRDYGITSYNFAVNGARIAAYEGMIREVMKYQAPDLFIIDLRSIAWEEEGILANEPGIRTTTDSLDYSFNRFRTVYEVLDFYETNDDVEKFSYYFDMAKYHGEYERMAEEERWKTVFANGGKTEYKGFEFVPQHESVDECAEMETNERIMIPSKTEQVIRELCQYLLDNGQKVLFVDSPFVANEERKKQINTVSDICAEYGYALLDSNEYYEKMGIDWGKDFYNTGHVNVYGAEKYTKLLADYIKETYQLTDHRGEAEYADWDDYAERAYVEDEKTKNAINEIIANCEKAYKEGKKLKNINNVYEWSNRIMNENYTVLVEGQGQGFLSKPTSNQILDTWAAVPENSAEIIRVYNGSQEVYRSDVGLSENYKNTFAGHSENVVSYEINSGGHGTILINGEEYSKKQNGLNIVVFDNNYREVLDTVVITQDENGEPILSR